MEFPFLPSRFNHSLKTLARESMRLSANRLKRVRTGRRLLPSTKIAVDDAWAMRTQGPTSAISTWSEAGKNRMSSALPTFVPVLGDLVTLLNQNLVKREVFENVHTA